MRFKGCVGICYMSVPDLYLSYSCRLELELQLPFLALKTLTSLNKEVRPFFLGYNSLYAVFT